MSAPQPPSQPGDGGEQPPQGPPSGPTPQQDSPFGTSEPTQVVQPGQPQPSAPSSGEGGLFGEAPEPTQVVRPGDANAGESHFGAESTQLVPPGLQPPAIPYA